MKDNIKTGMFVDYIGPSQEGLKHGDSKLVNESDEFGVRLVGVRGYFNHSDFTPSVPIFNKLTVEERSSLIEAALSKDKMLQYKNEKGFWVDVKKSNILAFNKNIAYRIKPEKLQSLDALYQKKATAQHMLLEAERDIELYKKGMRDDQSTDE